MTIRTMMLAGLMAATALGAVAPAYAQRGDDNGGRGRGGEMRQQRVEQRQQVNPGAQQQQHQQRTWQERPDRGAQVRTDSGVQVQGREWRGRGEGRQPQVIQQQPVTPQVRRDIREDRRDIREDRRDRREDVRDVRNGNNGWRDRAEDRRDWREDRRDVREDRRDVRNDTWRNDRRNDGSRDWGTRGWDNRNGANYAYGNRGRINERDRWSNQRRWDNGWRNDRRYDWQSYRRNYGQIYRPGRYYAPRGWNYGYRQFSIGIQLNSLLYSNNYWLNDPYQYRLPPAYGSLRWIRYYDDALLVDTRDGYVVDVINGFFY